jgi:Lectin C-type domain
MGTLLLGAAVVTAACGRVGFDDLLRQNGSLPGATKEGGAPDSSVGGNESNPTDAASGAGGRPGARDAGSATNSGGLTSSGGVASTGGTTSDGATSDSGTTSDGGAASDGGTTSDHDAGPCIAATYGGHDYTFCPTALAFADARNDCETRGMRLTRIDDDAENQFVASIAFAAYPAGYNNVDIWPWLGAYDTANPVEWRWVDGTVFWSGRNSGASVGGLYQSWASASPGDAIGVTCAAMNRGFMWVDRNCMQLHPYVCEAY